MTTTTARKEYKVKDFCFKDWGAFFAFGDDQYNKAKQEGVEYVSCGSIISGLVARKDNAREMLKAMSKHYEDENKKKLEVMGIDNIIAYELNNHECRYTGDIEDVMFLCEQYGVTKEKILEIYRRDKHLHEDDF